MQNSSASGLCKAAAFIPSLLPSQHGWGKQKSSVSNIPTVSYSKFKNPTSQPFCWICAVTDVRKTRSDHKKNALGILCHFLHSAKKQKHWNPDGDHPSGWENSTICITNLPRMNLESSLEEQWCWKSLNSTPVWSGIWLFIDTSMSRVPGSSRRNTHMEHN